MNGSELELQKVYETFQPKILRYLTWIVGEDEAEDLTQDVFIKVGIALAGFRGESSLSTWLYRIATNHAYDRMRSPTFQRTSSEKPCAESGGEDTEEIRHRDIHTGEKAPQVEQLVVKREMKACILRYLAKLPESYQTVVVLSDMEGLSNQEIVDILGVSLDTVKIRLHRARAKLREEIETHCEYYWVSELGWRTT